MRARGNDRDHDWRLWLIMTGGSLMAGGALMAAFADRPFLTFLAGCLYGAGLVLLIASL